MAKLVDGLVGLVPGAASAVVSAFPTPLLGGIAGLFIQMPFVARPRPASFERVGEGSPEPQAPGADALVAHDDATLRQDGLDVAQAQAEAVVQPYRVGDDLGWKAEAVIGVGLGLHARQPATPLRPWPS